MSEPSPGAVTKRVAQGRATREQLIEVATRLFAEQGYEGTSIEAVLAAAGVSRGALYHHFAGKDALFEAVVQSVENRVMAELAEVTRDATDPAEALNVAALAWIDMVGDPVIQRIMLLDAPSVLGWERWRDMDDNATLGAIRTVLQALSGQGRLAPDLVDAFAHMILAAIDEIALVIARADNPSAAMETGRAAVQELLRRLLTP